MSITSRIADAARPALGSLARSLGDRILGAPPPVVDAEPMVSASSSSNLLERAVDPGGMSQALSSGLYRNDSSPRRGAAELIELYRDSPRLRSAAHKVASGVAQVEWKLFAKVELAADDVERRYRFAPELIRAGPTDRRKLMARAAADGELEEFPVHPFHRLMDRPNPALSGQAARTVTQLHIDLLGEGFWVLDVASVGGQEVPVRAWPVPTHWVQSTPTLEKPVFEVNFPGWSGEVPANRMLWFRDVAPDDPYGRGAGLGMSLVDEVDIDEAAAKTVKGYFENQAIPPLLVSLKGARQDVVDRARMKWEKSLKGFRRAYQTFFTGSEISVQRLDTSFKDMALVDLRNSQRDVVNQTYGAPPEKLGIIENSNRSTIDASDLIWGKEVLTPRLELWRLELQRLVSLWDPRFVVDYVSPIPEDVARQSAVLSTQPAVFKINEQRAVAGLPPVADEEGGEGFLVDATRSWVQSLADLRPTIQPFHIAAGAITYDELRAALGLEPAGEEWGSERTTSIYVPPGGGLASTQPFPNAQPAGPDEDVPAPEPEIVADDVELRAARRVGHGKRATVVTVRSIRDVLGAIDPNLLARHMEPVVRKLVESFGEETIQAVDATKRFDMQDPKVQEHIRELVQDRIGRLINTTTRDNVRSAIVAWDGEDNDALVSSVRDVFDVARVERSQAIAETEGQRSRELASYVAMRQSGIVEQKEWVAVADSRTREAHLAMDGQLRGINEPFVVPVGKWTGAKTQVPGSFGIAALDIRCRCVSAPVFDLEPDVPDTERAARRAVLLGAGIVVRGATTDERAELWRAQDAKARRWETRIGDAAVTGFDEQEEAAMKVLLDVLG